MKSSTKFLYFLIAFLVINILVYVTKMGGEVFLLYFSDILPIVASFIAIVCVFFAFKSFKIYDLTKNAWLILLIGVVLNFLAESAYAYLELVAGKDMNEFFPSIADYFWCLAYPFFFIGLVMMFIGYRNSGFPMGKKWVYWAISLSILVLALFMLIFLIIPIMNDTETDARSKVFNIVYPVGDMLVVALAILLMYITSLFGKNSISTPWKFLAYGFIAFTIADLVYSYLSWKELYDAGSIIDVAWNYGYLMIGLAGLYQKELMESLKERK